MILVINFGSQFAHLIARRARALSVHSEIVPHTITANEIQKFNPDAVILSGGPDSVIEDGIMPDMSIFGLNIPILGICYGQQLIAQLLGGRVKKGSKREFGKEIIEKKASHALFEGWNNKEAVWFSHGDQVSELPKGFEALASTKECAFSAIGDDKRKIYGVQFHPEVTHTDKGIKLLENFLFKIAKSKKDWKIDSQKEVILEEIRQILGPRSHVLVALSGGVDSLVAATVVAAAIGEKRVHAVMVDTGLLRTNEAKEVQSALKGIGMNFLKVEDASYEFLTKLKGVSDPEEKRKIIGHSFIKVFERHIKEKLKGFPITHLVQGTIYPDRIESAEPTKHASKIKSHHNLTLPDEMDFEILEPIKELYKDEVRALGRTLGISDAFLNRHPFPGPGLGIRVLGEVTKDKVSILQKADAIFIEELHRCGEYVKIWQAFAALLPVRSVGVMGDSRTYDYILSLRAVTSIDGMTVDWYKMPYDLLGKISTRIVNEVRGVNRVVYDITQKPPGTIEYE